jgi:hypothetical protein
MLERIDIFNVSNLYSWLQYDSHTTPRHAALRAPYQAFTQHTLG